jgi:hypothetical protein
MPMFDAAVKEKLQQKNAKKRKTKIGSSQFSF